MAFLKWFAGKSAGDHEKRADQYAGESAWGKAKLEYEKALDKFESQPQQPTADKVRLHDKIRQSCQALAEQHLESGRNLLEAGYQEDAAELFGLALELCGDSPVRTQIEALQKQFSPKKDHHVAAADQPVADAAGTFEANAPPIDDQFMVLCSMLPENLQDIYAGYGPDFREGYVALHQGEFREAAEKLDQARQTVTDDDGYILLELAGAYFNLSRVDTARHLAEEFVQRQPDALPGYQLLCEIYWEQNDYDDARQLLEKCPQPLHDTVAYIVLFGETLRREANFTQAGDWFNGHLQKHGWNDKIGLALARVYEQSGQVDQSLALYSRYIGNCRGCGSTTAPEIERKYADLSLAGGNFSDEILEIYLSLARKDPTRAADYFHKVSRIYTERGNLTEARRFEGFAEQAKMDS